MRSINSLLLLLQAIFLFSLSLNLLRLARSDETLIRTLCDKTEEPVYCQECLESDPKSNSADAQGLALVALSCAEKDTTYLRNDSFNLYQQISAGNLKNILGLCVAHLSMAQQDFPPVARYVQNGSYGAAKDVVTGDIVPHVNYCLKLFNDAPDLPVPQQVLAGTVAANQTCNNAADILSNILSV